VTGRGATISDTGHTPVLLAEVLDALRPRDGGIYVDGTFGAGGYAQALLDAALTRVCAIDRDPAAIAAGAGLARASAGRLTLIEGRFGDMDRLVRAIGVERVDGVALDLGVSSMQIDDPARGFSFRADGPLDMRMGRDAGESAADLVAGLDEGPLADLIFRLGEERLARRVARAIVAARRTAPIETTAALAAIVRRVVPRAADGIDPATRTFQALRIAVNDELGEVDRGLAAAERILAPAGRLAVVAFHSLEDRAVKGFLRARGGGASGGGSRHLPPPAARPAATFRELTRRPLRPGADEVARNPRARSAMLRVAERTEAPPWPAAAGPAGTAEDRPWSA